MYSQTKKQIKNKLNIKGKTNIEIEKINQEIKNYYLEKKIKNQKLKQEVNKSKVN